MKDMMGGKGDEMELMAQSMDPDSLGAEMAEASDSPLGPNPFADGGNPLGGMPGLGAPGGMPGMRGGTKKNRKKKKKKR